MVRVLQPGYANIGKRLVKRPKIYLRDTGVFHSLMNIDNPDDLYRHPKLGASWEGFALECVCQSIGKTNQELYFWQVHGGSELDLFWQHAGKNWGVEFKYADAPRLSKAMTVVSEDLDLRRLWVIYPGKQIYRIAENITVFPLVEIPATWNYQ